MLPDVIFFAGKKASGKDWLCDLLVAERGFAKLHIAEPWLRRNLDEMGVSWDEWEANKPLYRPEIQQRASAAREADPYCLLQPLPSYLEPLLMGGQKVAVSGIRFRNETEWAIDRGYLVVRVVTPIETRRERFAARGEPVEMLDDPFEREVDSLLVHFDLFGDLSPAVALRTLEVKSYATFRQRLQHT